MPGIDLSVNFIAGLDLLAQMPGMDFQYVRLGSWFDDDTVNKIVTQFPGKRFLYHHNGNLQVEEAETEALIITLQARQQRTGSPWLSAHLDHHTDAEIHYLLKEGRRPPSYGRQQALEMVCLGVQAVKPHLPVPLLLENVDHWPLPEVDLAVLPDFIAQVISETGCGFLLDTAHAKISAHWREWDVREYIERLPLKHVVEIHVCGTGWEGGQIVDIHSPMEDEDYALLQWLLRRTRPRAITLEYAENMEPVPSQVARLNRIIAAAAKV
jgi:uncharacterized protein (UPF0276 family)